jgi:hypothetical protein
MRKGTKSSERRSIVLALQQGPENLVLEEALKSLRHDGRDVSAALHARKVAVGYCIPQQRLGEVVGCGHGVLNGEIDADTADR